MKKRYYLLVGGEAFHQFRKDFKFELGNPLTLKERFMIFFEPYYHYRIENVRKEVK